MYDLRGVGVKFVPSGAIEPRLAPAPSGTKRRADGAAAAEPKPCGPLRHRPIAQAETRASLRVIGELLEVIGDSMTRGLILPILS